MDGGHTVRNLLDEQDHGVWGREDRYCYLYRYLDFKSPLLFSSGYAALAVVISRVNSGKPFVFAIFLDYFVRLPLNFSGPERSIRRHGINFPAVDKKKGLLVVKGRR